MTLLGIGEATTGTAGAASFKSPFKPEGALQIATGSGGASEPLAILKATIEREGVPSFKAPSEAATEPPGLAAFNAALEPPGTLATATASGGVGSFKPLSDVLEAATETDGAVDTVSSSSSS